MAQTQLNRIYVQSLDATGGSVNSLSLGTKALTTSVFIGGTGTSNNITINTTGITMSGPTTFPTGLSTTVLTATGNTTLINTSMANLGVTGNASIANASINAMTVVGRTTLNNASVVQLGVTGNASMVIAAINTLSVVGQSTLLNVSSSALTVANQLNVVGNTSLQGTTFTTLLVANNASINGQVNVAGATSVKDLGVAGTANLYGAVNVTGTTQINATGTAGTSIGNTTAGTTINSTLGITGATSITGTLGVTGATTINTTGSDPTTMGSATSATSVGGTLGVTGQTTLQNASITGTLAVRGNCSVNAVTATGTTTINTTGSATTTIGSGSSGTTVGGTLGVTGQTTLQNASITGTLAVTGNCSMNGLTATGATTINTTGSATTTIGSATSGTTVGGTLGVTGQTTLQNASVTGNLSVTGSLSMNNVTVTALTAGSVTTSNVSTTSLNATNAYVGAKPTLFNYGPTFVDRGGATISGNELSVTITGGQDRSSNTPIPTSQFFIGAKFLVTITARGTAGTSIYPLQQVSSINYIQLTTVMTTYTVVVTVTSVPDYTLINLRATGTGTITWSTITIEPYSELSVNGTMDVSGSLTVRGNCSMNNVSTSALTVTGAFTAQDRIIASSIWPQNYRDMSLGERLFVGGGLTLQYYMTEGFYKLWPTVSNPGYDAGGNYYQINILATSSVNNRDRFEKVFSLPAVGKKVQLEMTISSTGTDTTVSFYHPTTTLLYTTPVLTTTMTRYTFEFTVTSNARDYNIVMTPGKAYVLRLQTLSTNVYDGDFVGIGVSSWYRSATTNATTGQIVSMPSFETSIPSKIGAWFMYRPSDQLSTCLGTISENVASKFALHQNTDGSTNGLTVLNSAGSINFNILDSAKMTLSNAGNVGIGTMTPRAPLHVALKGTTDISGHYYFDSYRTDRTANYSWGLNPSGYGLGSCSITADGYIITSIGFIGSSDRRIKANIIDVVDDEALVIFRKLKPKTYTYIDVVQRGKEPVFGFIAQEVGEVVPYSIVKETQTVPNIYELATFTNDMITLTFKTSDLSRDASGALFTKLKLKTKEGKDEFMNIVEVVNEHTLRVDKDLTEWGGKLDGSGNVVSGDQIFVYGQEVNDFHNLNKDAIWTVATAALQEVDRQLQAEKQKVITLETTLASVQDTLATLITRMAALEQKS